MSDAYPSRRSMRPVRRRIYRRWWFWVAIGLLVVVLGAAAWVGVRGLAARDELLAAQSLIPQLKQQAAALDIEGANETFTELQQHSSRAVELTGDPVWRAAEITPFLGRNLTVVRELTAVTDDTVSDVIEPLLSVAGDLDPAAFAPHDGRIDIAPLIAAVPAVAEAGDGLDGVEESFARIDVDGTVGAVSDGYDKFATLLADAAPLVRTLNTVVPLLPPVLGSDAPRTYALMFQNNAELRALGGTALSFAVVTVDKGAISLTATIPAGLRNFVDYQAPIIPVPDGVAHLYPLGEFGGFISNSTVRPSFSTAAEIVQENWRRQFGYEVDGIVSVDPIALSYVLRATDPIALSTGDQLTSQSLVPLLLNQVYQRFNTDDLDEDNRDQDAVYSEAVTATFSRLTHGPLDPKLLIAAVTQGWDERRILFWSAHEEEQAQLAAAGLNGELPLSDDNVERIGVYFQDRVGAKLNFYLQQAVGLAQASCAPGPQNYRVTVSLSSTLAPDAVAGLSRSITGQYKREGLAPGVQRLLVYLYAPPGSQILGATIDGTAVGMEAQHDTDYPVGVVRVEVAPGATVTVTYDLISSSDTPRTLEAQVTPAVNPTTITNESIDCSTIPVG